MGASLCSPKDERVQIVEPVPNTGDESERVYSPDEAVAAAGTAPTLEIAEAANSDEPENREKDPLEMSSTTLGTRIDVSFEEREGEKRPTLHKKKSILKRSVSTSSGQESLSSGSPARKLKIGKSQEQLIPMKTADEKELRISYGSQDIKRTGTYAALGLGYLIDSADYEQELARRSIQQSKLPSIFGDPEDESGPDFTTEYKIEEEIATGGFGPIFRAVSRHAVGGRPMCVKQVLKVAVVNNKAVDVFRVETSILKEMDHPNLAWRSQVFQTPDSLFLVMDLCKGPSLFEKLCGKGTLSRRTTCRYAYHVLSGLSFLHENGIMHRDIKPENLLLTSEKADAQVKIIDFAVARIYSPGDKIETKVGTLAYTAPEILRGLYNERVDIWALGCVLFLSVSGCLPAYSRFDDEMVRFIMEGRIAWYLISWLDNDLLNLIKSCLETDVLARPGAGELTQLHWLSKVAHSQPSCCGF